MNTAKPQQLSLVPWPLALTERPDGFTADASLALVTDTGCATATAWLAGFLRRATGWGIPVSNTDPFFTSQDVNPLMMGSTSSKVDRAVPGAVRCRQGRRHPPGGCIDNVETIHIVLGISLEDGGIPGSYRLETGPGRVSITGTDAAGVFHACQTLRQLLLDTCESSGGASDGFSLPGLIIHDAPRFPWRGALLDSARGFHPVEDVLGFLDILAFYKLNRLHWHLTDDQGWRIPIPGRPRLTEVGGWQVLPDGGRLGGSYSADDIRTVLDYAAARQIMVIPEIDMPGHTAAATASYPELSCRGIAPAIPLNLGNYPDVLCPGNETVYAFVSEVLTEVARLFPSPFIHIGGDECIKAHWRECPRCQALIREQKLGDVKGLEHYFTTRVAGIVQGLGKRLIGWDETLETASPGIGHEVQVSYPSGPAEDPLPADTIIQSWRAQSGVLAAARLGHQVIVSPYFTYLNYGERQHPLERLYHFEPVPAELDAMAAARILGMESCLWGSSTDKCQRTQNLLPRLCAMAESGWTASTGKDWEGFRRRMIPHRRRWERQGLAYGSLEAVAVTFDRPQATDASGIACTVRFRLQNLADETVVAECLGGPEADSIPAGIKLTLASRQTVEVDLRVQSRRPWDTRRPIPVELLWYMRIGNTGLTPLIEEHRVLIAPDPLLPCPAASAGLPHAVTLDGTAIFGLHHDEASLHILVHVRKPVLHSQPGIMPWLQDGLEIRIDGRSDAERFASDGEFEFKDLLLIAVSPGDGPEGYGTLYRAKDLPQGTRVVCRPDGDGFSATITVPKAWFQCWQPDGLRTFRLNIAVNHYEGGKVTQESWRPAWRSPESYPWAGTCEILRP